MENYIISLNALYIIIRLLSLLHTQSHILTTNLEINYLRTEIYFLSSPGGMHYCINYYLCLLTGLLLFYWQLLNNY